MYPLKDFKKHKRKKIEEAPLDFLANPHPPPLPPLNNLKMTVHP
jgi:hypothetical protein